MHLQVPLRSPKPLRDLASPLPEPEGGAGRHPGIRRQARPPRPPQGQHV